jgi:hypothetical protein
MTLFAKTAAMLSGVAEAYDAVAKQRVDSRARVQYHLLLIPGDEATGEIVHGGGVTPVFFDGALVGSWTLCKKSNSDDFATKDIALTRKRVLMAEIHVSILRPHGASSSKALYFTRGLAKWDAEQLQLHSSFPDEAPLLVKLKFDKTTKAFVHAELTHSPSDQPFVFNQLKEIAFGYELDALHALPVNTVLGNLQQVANEDVELLY